jgi:S-adenosylmethionine synthetase
MRITAESVKQGHPDIVADSIAANIIAEILDEEGKIGLDVGNMPHCGLEVFLGKGLCVVGGEVSTRVYVDIDRSVRRTVVGLGYNDCAVGLNGYSMGVINAIIPQSEDINIGSRADLGKYKEMGAGDQGIIYGYACDETQELLPATYVLVNRLMRALETSGDRRFAPDGKGQVTMEYQGGKPVRLATVLISNALDYRYMGEDEDPVAEEAARKIARDTLGKWFDGETEFLFNPTGRWRSVNSCSAADSGVTGRKLVVQFYGGYPGAQLGGGSVVNKSPEKVDCSAAFGARHVAKNIVAAGLATRCSVQIAYAIGIARPIAVYVNSFGTGRVSDEKLAYAVNKSFDLTPRGLIERFGLLRGDIYRRLPAGFFLGDFPWEKTEMVEVLGRQIS